MKCVPFPLAIPALALFLFHAPLRAEAPLIQPTDLDVKSLLAPPPAQGSSEEQAEIAQILRWQATRTPLEVARSQAEEEVTVFAFADVLGPWFTEHDLPTTATLMQRVQKDAKAFTNDAKKIWNRKRPPLVDSRIKPCVSLEKSGSYPSGHATRGILWATLLAEIFPDKRDALLARGTQIGDDRALAGMHYASDVVAGQKLGAAIAAKLLADPNFKAELDKAKAECIGAEAKAKGSM